MKVQQIALCEILEDVSRNHRVDVERDDVEGLASDIDRMGLINPVTVRKVDGGYRVVAGTRRVAACRMLGSALISAVVRDLNDGGEAGVRMAENLLQKSLTPVEEGLALGGWMHDADLCLTEAARLLGRRPEWITSRLDIQNYHPHVQQALHARVIPLGTARALSVISDEDRLVEMLEYIERTGANVRTVVSWVQDWEREAAQGTYEGGRSSQPDQTYRPVVPMTTCAVCGSQVRLGAASQVCLCAECVPIMQEVGRSVRDASAAPNSPGPAPVPG